MGVGTWIDEPASLRSLLLPQDPYADFSIEGWAPDLQGWGFRHPLFGELIAALRPRIIVEVGTWKGASAIHMAQEAKRHGIRTEIICVDTWLGSAGTILRRDETFRSLRHRHGYPQLYYQFLANVVHAGADDVIVPLPQTSDNAARILEELEIRPNLVYLDAAHDGAAVRRDLESYLPLLREPGALFGDDFVERHRPGLVRAVREFASDHGLRLHSDREKFVITRDPGMVERLTKARRGWRRALWRARRIAEASARRPGMWGRMI
jgi:predicted O-methyltransferase YrrM